MTLAIGVAFIFLVGFVLGKMTYQPSPPDNHTNTGWSDIYDEEE